MRPTESGGRGRKWERDEAGRKYYEQAGARVFESRQDRDAALNDRYIKPPCGEDCCANILAHVSAHRDSIVMRLMDWVSSHNLSLNDKDTLRRFEVDYFHDRLPPADHGVLAFAVSVARFGDRYERARKRRGDPKLTPGLTSEQRRDRMLEALDEVVENKVIPMDRQSWSEKDKQMQKLREQAARAPAGEREDDDEEES